MNNLEFFQMIMIIILSSFVIGLFVDNRLLRKRINAINPEGLKSDLIILRSTQDRMLKTASEQSVWKAMTQQTVARHENQLKLIIGDKKNYTMYVSAHYEERKNKLLQDYLKQSKDLELEAFKEATDKIFGTSKVE